MLIEIPQGGVPVKHELDRQRMILEGIRRAASAGDEGAAPYVARLPPGDEEQEVYLMVSA